MLHDYSQYNEGNGKTMSALYQCKRGSILQSSD